jgi:DNA polymerase III sliding clamp (beta) subunit (PCNA family)
MKLKKKKLNTILSQIKAHLNIVVMMDNPEHPGLIDFIFQPKSKEIESGYLNRLTCGIGGGDDLFADTVIETLGNPLVIDITRFRDALKCGEFEPELKNGVVNGINIEIDTDDLKNASMGSFINNSWDNIKNSKFPDSIKFEMPRIDYELMADTMTQHVSHDIARISMCGYDIDFSKGEDFINFIATDGRRLAVCKFPCKHPKMGDDEGENGNFIFRPLHFFIPESDYSRTQWSVNKYCSLVRIQTEDYSIDCWAKPIEGLFPNYIKVIPGQELIKEWMILNARSARNAFDSIKGLINNDRYSSVKNKVSFDAEDPKHIKLAISGASVDIYGEASRPMCLKANWDYMNSAFFDTPSTKFLFQDNVNKAILTEESRAIRGTTMTITKLVMPMEHEDYVDEWGLVNRTQNKTAINDSSEETESKEIVVVDEQDDDTTLVYGNSLSGDY